jgi:hypothetical protein
VNISNGGTVTAITRTAAGSAYTTVPSLAISAPTTAGGVQATATANLGVLAATIVGGGIGYTAGDTLTIVGGTGTAAQLTVGTVSSGIIATVTVAAQNGVYSVFPTSPVSVTGGTGSGATFNISGGILSAFTITNAGSGYVEQPTVTFSGGGGSGAAAYATVGAGTRIRSIGATLDLYSPNAAIGLRVEDTGGTSSNYWRFRAGGGQLLATAEAVISSGGSNSVRFLTNGISQEQLRVAHTASAVNYVQVTGAATGSGPIISTQGSDTNVDLLFSTKGTAGSHVFRTNSTVRQFQINHVTSAVNYGVVTGSIAGNAVPFTVAGTDTDIDLALTPKGTGNVRFGTFTSSILTPTGFITIKDSGGTTRRILIG